MTGPLLLPVLQDAHTPGWPKSEHAPEIGYVEIAEAFTQTWPTDAHFAAYSVPGVRRRLTLDALDRLSAGWPMVLLVVDVDGPGHRRTPEWWSAEQSKIDAVLAVHPGGFMYATRGGYRLVWRLPALVTLRTVDDKEAWRQRYRRELLYLARVFNIQGDPACADITRLYRLPRATRDPGGAPEDHPRRGSPSNLGAWGHQPCMDELTNDIATARTLASVDAKAWGPVLRSLTSDEASREGAGAELHPEDQDEARLHKRAAAYLASMAPSVAGAGGNAALWSAALAMVRGFCLGASTGATILLRDFNPRCSPPWPRAEIERTCRNAAERGEQPWGYARDADGGEAGLHDKPSQRRQHHAKHTSGPSSSTAGAKQPPTDEGAPMPDPTHNQSEEESTPFLPLMTSRDLPAFPIGALPATVATFAAQLADYLECPADLPACLALGALASVCMKRYEASPRVDWREPLNLYLAVALEPGESKSPAFRQVFGPLYALQKKMGEDWKEECKRIEERNADKAKGEPDEPQPIRPRLFIDDATPEKIGVVLAEQGERITLASDEGTAFQHMCGLYSKNAQPNAGVYLKAHDGGHYVVDRMARASIHLENPLMTVALAVQPTVIRELSKRPDLRGRGLWGRFAYAFPASRVGTRTFDTPPVDPKAKDEWRDLLTRLASPPQPATPEVLSFAPDAQRRFHQAENEIERALVAGGALSSARDWANKLRGFLARVAGLLHVADEIAPGQTCISLATVEKALEIGRYFTRHALYTFDVEMTLDPAEQAARQVWEVIQRKGWERVTPRDVSRAIKSLRKTPDAIAALEVLCRQGCLERAQAHHGKAYVVRRPGRGKPPGGDTVDHGRPNVDPMSTGEEEQKSQQSSDKTSSSTDSVDPSHARTRETPPRSHTPGDNGDNGDNGHSSDVSGIPGGDSRVDSPGDNASTPPPASAERATSANDPQAPPADVAAGDESEGYL